MGPQTQTEPLCELGWFHPLSFIQSSFDIPMLLSYSAEPLPDPHSLVPMKQPEYPYT